jgi:hypothetical protein
MPTALVAAKPVPATVTESPGMAVVGVNVMAAVCALVICMAARTIESVRKAIIATVYTFFLCCTFTSSISMKTAYYTVLQRVL